jgi:hypothetical protein
MRISKELYAYHKNGTIHKSETVRNVLKARPDVKAQILAEKLKVDQSLVYFLRKELLPKTVEVATGKSLEEAYDEVTLTDNIDYDMMGYAPSVPVIRTAQEHDPVNHPSHYTVGGIETIDFIEAKGLNYNLGNVVKYMTRADHKGNKVEDLKKALWYLNRELQNLQK